MDSNDDLIYSFEEQCFMNIESLRLQILEEEAENLAKCKRWQRHRLFKCNIFEEVEPCKKQYLEKILCHTLRSLGQKINDNLVEAARKKEPSLRTPTPCRDLTVSPVSSRTQSITPARALRSRSASNASDLLDPVIEVIVISSDEEISDNEENCVKIEPEEADLSDRMSPSDNRADFHSDDILGPFPSDEVNDPRWQENSLIIVNRKLSSNYIYDKNGVIHLKPKKYIKFSALSVSRQPLFLHIVAKVIKLIESDSFVTKRELYYLSKEFCKMSRAKQTGNSQTQSSGFQSQTNGTQTTDSERGTQSQRNSNRLTRYNPAKIDATVDDLCCLLGCSRVHLRILAQSKGLVYGNLKFTLKNGEIFDCLSKKEGINLPTARVPIVHVESNAKFILILEKDSVFQKILKQEDSVHFVENYKVILFTAKGYPDITSKAFLNYIWSRLKIPILALTDADPHGMEIVCSYKFGCYSTAYESLYLAVPQIKWLGLLPGDVKRLNIPEYKTLPQTTNDKKKLSSLLTRPYLKNRDGWILQLELMLSSGRKAELESLDQDGEYLVGSYLPNKLKYHSWL